MPEKEKNKKTQTKKEKSDNKKAIIPPLDFSSLFFPFYTQALIKLGLAKDPLTGKEDEDVELSKRLIDLLELLKERTQGNLKAEEEKILDSCLNHLRMAYLEKEKIIKL